MRIQRHRFSTTLAVILTALALALAACTSDTTAEVPTGDENLGTEEDPATGEDTQPEPESIELTAGHFMSTEHPMHVHLLEPLRERLAEGTDGRVQMTIHPGGALGPPPGQYDAALGGVMDVAFGLQGYTPGRFPLTEVVTLPFLFESATDATEALQYLFENSPDLQAEYEGVKVLALWTHDTGQLLMADQPATTPADLQGREVIATTQVVADLAESLGGTPVVRPVTEVYDSIERGVVDGVMLPLSTLLSFNLDEVIDYATVGSFYVDTFFLVMHLDAWESLSADDQAAVEEIIGRQLSLQAAEAYSASEQAGFQRLDEAGIEVYRLTDEERDQWRAQAQPVHDNWIAQREAEGLPAQAVYDIMMEFIGQQ